MATIQEINRAIVSGTFTNEELNTIVDAIKFARTQMTQKNRRSMVIGTSVEFNNTRSGTRMTGTVEKVALKFITVRTSTGLWRVPASMLSFA